MRGGERERGARELGGEDVASENGGEDVASENGGEDKATARNRGGEDVAREFGRENEDRVGRNSLSRVCILRKMRKKTENWFI